MTTDSKHNAGLGRAGLDRQGRAQTPDDIDRCDQYLPTPLISMSKIESAAITVVVACGFAGLLTLLWWVGRP
jgi:hypothetical protein